MKSTAVASALVHAIHLLGAASRALVDTVLESAAEVLSNFVSMSIRELRSEERSVFDSELESARRVHHPLRMR